MGKVEKIDSLPELTQAQYLGTFHAPMANVTETAEPLIDIWPYASLLVEKKVLPAVVVERCLVEAVYRDQTDTYDHVLLPSHNANTVISLIVDRPNKKMVGYYVLDLRKQYGL